MKATKRPARDPPKRPPPSTPPKDATKTVRAEPMFEDDQYGFQKELGKADQTKPKSLERIIHFTLKRDCALQQEKTQILTQQQVNFSKISSSSTSQIELDTRPVAVASSVGASKKRNSWNSPSLFVDKLRRSLRRKTNDSKSVPDDRRSSQESNKDVSASPQREAAAEVEILTGWLRIEHSGVLKHFLPKKKRWCILNPWLGCLFYWKTKEQHIRGAAAPKCMTEITDFRILARAPNAVYQLLFKSGGTKDVALVSRLVCDQLAWEQALQFITHTSCEVPRGSGLSGMLKDSNPIQESLVALTPYESLKRAKEGRDVSLVHPSQTLQRAEAEKLKFIRNAFNEEFSKYQLCKVPSGHELSKKRRNLAPPARK